MVWKFLNLPDPTPVQYDIANYLQYGPRRCIIEAFRGVGKSWITSAFVCWLLYCDPQLNILVASASKQRADDFSTFTLRLINDMEILQHLRPRDNQRSSKIAFDVAPADNDHAPSVKSVGISGQLAGSRADYIVADDVEIPNNSATQAMRDKLSEAVKEFDAILKPGGRVIYLGTPQCEMSLYNALLERGYDSRIWPARVPSAAKMEKYVGKLAPMVIQEFERDPEANAGKPFDPLRFGEDDLLEREASYGRSGFALQFMLDTSLSDLERFPLRTSDLVVMDLHPQKGPADLAWASGSEQVIDTLPALGLGGDRWHKPMWVSDEWAEYEGIVMAVDPSGRGKDETGYSVVAMLYGRLYVLDTGGFKGGYDEKTLTQIAHKAGQYRVHKVIVEPNFGDGMFDALLKPYLQRIYPCALEETERSQTQKEARIIDTLEPVMNQHRVVVDKALIERDYESTLNLPAEDINRYRLFFQLTRITRERGAIPKDDRLDALALAVHYWTERMNRDTATAFEEHKQEMLDHELERFMENVVGYRPRRDRWVDV